jgi:ABC-type dipeptide/oligopeptide/nickel transport system permease component
MGTAVLRLGAARLAARMEARIEGGACAAAARLRAIAAENQKAAPSGTTAAAPKSTLSQLKDSFLNWDLYKQAIPDLLKTGLPNTLILTVSAAVIGLVLGMGWQSRASRGPGGCAGRPACTPTSSAGCPKW